MEGAKRVRSRSRPGSASPQLCSTWIALSTIVCIVLCVVESVCEYLVQCATVDLGSLMPTATLVVVTPLS